MAVEETATPRKRRASKHDKICKVIRVMAYTKRTPILKLQDIHEAYNTQYHGPWCIVDARQLRGIVRTHGTEMGLRYIPGGMVEVLEVKDEQKVKRGPTKN